jgi:signal transduction histidine kinase
MIIFMRNADSPYLTDLFAISLRWLALFGFAISIAAGSGLNLSHGGATFLKISILALPALWNGFLSALAIFNRRLKLHRQINVALDIVFAMLLFIGAGGYTGEVAWAALLPMFSGAIYYEVRGVVAAAAIISLLQGGYTLLFSDGVAQLQVIGLMAAFNMSAAIIIALLNAPLIGELRHSYKKTVAQRKESEQRVKRQERDRMKALFQMIETFSSTLNYQTVLQTVLNTALEALEERGSKEHMVGAVLLFDERNELMIRAARGFLPTDSNMQLPADEGVLKELLSGSEPLVLYNPAQDPELSKLMTIQECQAALCLPLIRGMTAYGFMLFAHKNAGFFSAERVETLQMLCNQALIALQNASLYQDLDREKERLQQTQEDEKKKLARSLHDGPTQSLAAIAMRISVARRLLETSPEEAADEMMRAEELARRTTQEIRHMLFMLRPLVLESEGLIAALQALAEKMFDLYQQKLIIEADPDVAALLDNNRQATIFYLAEESINNARKHAQASQIWVRLKFAQDDPDIAQLEIIDNGIGFNVQSVLNSYDRRGSLGMINLRERTDMINGLLNIESIPGKGTRICMLIPLNKDAEERLHNRRIVPEKRQANA